MPNCVRPATAPALRLTNAIQLLFLALLFLVIQAQARAITPAPDAHTSTNNNETHIQANQTRLIRSPDNNESTKNETHPAFPFNVLVVLPKYESTYDKFGLTIAKARSVIEIAVDDIIVRELLPKNWIRLSYEDSRYWDEPMLAEKWAVNAVIKAQCKGELDAVVGLADPYSLATVAKISAGFGSG